MGINLLNVYIYTYIELIYTWIRILIEKSCINHFNNIVSYYYLMKTNYDIKTSERYSYMCDKRTGKIQYEKSFDRISKVLQKSVWIIIVSYVVY